jgi:hypothetical protein
VPPLTLQIKENMQKTKLQLLLIFFLGLLFGLLMEFSVPLIFALLIVLIATYIYTMRDATGLKHNQDKCLIAVSVLLYFGALAISLYSTIILVLLTAYEVSNRKDIKTLSIRLFPYVIITIISVFIFI